MTNFLIIIFLIFKFILHSDVVEEIELISSSNFLSQGNLIYISTIDQDGNQIFKNYRSQEIKEKNLGLQIPDEFLNNLKIKESGISIVRVEDKLIKNLDDLKKEFKRMVFEKRKSMILVLVRKGKFYSYDDIFRDYIKSFLENIEEQGIVTFGNSAQMKTDVKKHGDVNESAN